MKNTARENEITKGRVVNRESSNGSRKITIRMDTASKGKVLSREIMKDGTRKITIRMG